VDGARGALQIRLKLGPDRVVLFTRQQREGCIGQPGLYVIRWRGVQPSICPAMQVPVARLERGGHW